MLVHPSLTPSPCRIFTLGLPGRAAASKDNDKKTWSVTGSVNSLSMEQLNKYSCCISLQKGSWLGQREILVPAITRTMGNGHEFQQRKFILVIMNKLFTKNI